MGSHGPARRRRDDQVGKIDGGARNLQPGTLHHRIGEMRRADHHRVDRAIRRADMARHKPPAGPLDAKLAPGGLVDLEFIAQYLQLVHAADHPEILDTTTARVFDKALRLGVLSAEDADVLRPAIRLFHNLTQVLRLCLAGPFEPKTAGAGLLGLLCRAADLPNFKTLDAHVADTRQKVRATFDQILATEP